MTRMTEKELVARIAAAERTKFAKAGAEARWRKENTPAAVKLGPPTVAVKRNKYGNVPIEIPGEGRFDSKGEAERFLELKMLQRAGQISGLARQVPFGLTVKGKMIGTYVADFWYVDHTIPPREVVEDYKPGVRTDLYLWKKKHMLAEHGIEILETGSA